MCNVQTDGSEMAVLTLEILLPQLLHIKLCYGIQRALLTLEMLHSTARNALPLVAYEVML